MLPGQSTCATPSRPTSRPTVTTMRVIADALAQVPHEHPLDHHAQQRRDDARAR